MGSAEERGEAHTEAAGSRPARKGGPASGCWLLSREAEASSTRKELCCEPRAPIPISGPSTGALQPLQEEGKKFPWSSSFPTVVMLRPRVPQPSPLSFRGTHPQTSSSPWHRSFLSKATTSLQHHTSLATVSRPKAWGGDVLQAGRIEILAPGDGATRCDAEPWWPSAVLTGVSQKPGAR